MASRARRPTVLMVLHQEHSTPGRVGRALRAMDARLDIRRPSLDEPLPKTLTDHDGVVVFGGPMCANDECEWMKREIDWLDVAARRGEAVPGDLPRGADAGARARRPRLHLRGQAQRDRLCADRAQRRRRPALRRALPALGLPVAHRRLRPAGGRRTSRHRGQGFPQPGLSLRQESGRPAVPPGSDLSHDVPVDDPRRRAADPARARSPAPASSAAGISTTGGSPPGSTPSCRPGWTGGSARRPRRSAPRSAARSRPGRRSI